MKIIEQIINVLFIIILIIIIIKMISNSSVLGELFPLITLPIASLFQSFVTQFIYKYLSIKQENILEDAIFYAYIFIESFVMLWFFFISINKPQIKYTIQVLAIILCAFYLYMIFNNYSKLKIIYSIFLITEGIIMIVLSVFTLIEILFDDSIDSLLKSPKFLLTFGILFFFSMTFPINTISTYLIVNDFPSFIVINNFTLIGYIIFYTILFISIDKMRIICLTKSV